MKHFLHLHSICLLRYLIFLSLIFHTHADKQQQNKQFKVLTHSLDFSCFVILAFIFTSFCVKFLDLCCSFYLFSSLLWLNQRTILLFSRNFTSSRSSPLLQFLRHFPDSLLIKLLCSPSLHPPTVSGERASPPRGQSDANQRAGSDADRRGHTRWTH